jgi:GTPase
LNKMDRPEIHLAASRTEERTASISALTGAGVEELLAAVDEMLPFDLVTRARFRFPLGEGGAISLLHEAGRVIETRYDESGCEIDAEVSESLRRRLEPFLVS